MIWFIADTHFGDDRIRRYEARPFANVAEMDSALVRNWNSVVRPQDTVYLLGDFAAPGCERIFTKLQGEKYLVKGNHDTRNSGFYRGLGFREVYDRPVILDEFWILSHEPLYVNANMPYANLFGHVHNSPQYTSFSKQHFCVCAERIGYTPVSYAEVRHTIFEQE